MFGEIMAGPGCYGGVRRCSARLWRDLDVMAVFGDVMAVLWRCSAMFGKIMAGPGCYGEAR